MKTFGNTYGILFVTPNVLNPYARKPLKGSWKFPHPTVDPKSDILYIGLLFPGCRVNVYSLLGVGIQHWSCKRRIVKKPAFVSLTV